MLLVEDEALIAMDLAVELEGAGLRVVGPSGSLAHGLELVDGNRVDVALLDINLRGERVFAIADALLERGVPMVFLSGENESSLPERLRHIEIVSKPADTTALAARVRALVVRSADEALPGAGTSPGVFVRDTVSAFLADSDLPVSFAGVAAGEPLLYVNRAFEALTGQPAADCVGLNCRFLQGPDTDASAVARVREGIDAREFRLTALRNHRADGTAFTNGLLVGPVNGADGTALALVGMQWDVGETIERRRARLEEAHWESAGPSVRLDHFERLVHMTLEASRERDPGADPTAFVERLAALAHPHQYPPHDRLPNWTRADSLLAFLIRPYRPGPLDGLRVEEDTGVVAVDVAYALSLAVHALARATWGLSTPRDRAEPDTGPGIDPDVSCRLTAFREEPVLEVRWRVASPRAAASGPAASRARAGLDVVAELLARLDGTFEFELDRAGLDALLRLPNRPYDVLDGS